MLTLINKLKQIIIKDEGSNITTDVSSINFTGAGVTASAVGNDVTVNIPGGGGSTWLPVDVGLDAWLSSGASTLVNANAGFQKSFSATANNAVIAQLPLDSKGIAYDGSTIKIRLSSQLFVTAPVAGDNVIWRLAYVFVSPGEDGDTKAATTIDTTISVAGRLANQIYVDDLPNMSGAVGSKFIGITLTRLSSGGGTDTYPGPVDVFAIEIIKP